MLKATLCGPALFSRIDGNIDVSYGGLAASSVLLLADANTAWEAQNLSRALQAQLHISSIIDNRNAHSPRWHPQINDVWNFYSALFPSASIH